MALPNWGDLQKSQADPETIEEAIVRIIGEHNYDSEAHLDSGQSLQSHKASEIIDHLAESIIADKIADNVIEPKKFSFGDVFYYNGIQTLDPFEQEIDGTGGSIVMEGYGAVVLNAGSAANNRTRLALEGGFQSMYIEDDPVFEAHLNDGSDYKGETRACIGSDDPFDTNQRQIGFRCDQDNSKVYAYVISNSGYSEWQVQADIFVSELYRIVVDSANKEIKWYIDGVLKKTYDYTGKTFWSGTAKMFSFGAKRHETGGAVNLHAWNVFFTKKHAIEY